MENDYELYHQYRIWAKYFFRHNQMEMLEFYNDKAKGILNKYR